MCFSLLAVVAALAVMGLIMLAAVAVRVAIMNKLELRQV
jgi:hypothetical protein